MPLSHQSIVAVNLPGPDIVAGGVIVFFLKRLTMLKTISLSTGTDIQTFLQFHQKINLFFEKANSKFLFVFSLIHGIRQLRSLWIVDRTIYITTPLQDKETLFGGMAI
ncbi:hypothetical protein NC653_004122 [Populus alba x Populus x berolinensis]|uniref:Uncharacterized protein n=1 Tax=Populus alba x Populus x berolinensis TaxID=444605 RepID=A0AAD6WM90_9ROSI|nr:hypothetical protein NC653_004122 [Populus alba x Populus x berolinensis]